MMAAYYGRLEAEPLEIFLPSIRHQADLLKDRKERSGAD